MRIRLQLLSRYQAMVKYSNWPNRQPNDAMSYVLVDEMNVLNLRFMLWPIGNPMMRVF